MIKKTNEINDHHIIYSYMGWIIFITFLGSFLMLAFGPTTELYANRARFIVALILFVSILIFVGGYKQARSDQFNYVDSIVVGIKTIYYRWQSYLSNAYWHIIRPSNKNNSGKDSHK